MQHSFVAFNKAFPNILAYSSIAAHPQYKILGPVYSAFYTLRPLVWTYVCFRMTRFLYFMIKRLLHDEEDMRYIGFRYTDQKVSPDGMTGYYPYQNMRYGDFLHKKEDSRGIARK